LQYLETRQASIS